MGSSKIVSMCPSLRLGKRLLWHGAYITSVAAELCLAAIAACAACTWAFARGPLLTELCCSPSKGCSRGLCRLAAGATAFSGLLALWCICPSCMVKQPHYSFTLETLLRLFSCSGDMGQFKGVHSAHAHPLRGPVWGGVQIETSRKIIFRCLSTSTKKFKITLINLIETFFYSVLQFVLVKPKR